MSQITMSQMNLLILYFIFESWRALSAVVNALHKAGHFIEKNRNSSVFFFEKGKVI